MIMYELSTSCRWCFFELSTVQLHQQMGSAIVGWVVIKMPHPRTPLRTSAKNSFCKCSKTFFMDVNEVRLKY